MNVRIKELLEGSDPISELVSGEDLSLLDGLDDAEDMYEDDFADVCNEDYWNGY